MCVVLAVLVLALQKPVLAIGGFLAFGVAGTVLLRLLGLRPDASVTVLAFFVAGIIGAALVFIVFDWALIVISSLNGATTIVGTLVSAGVARVGTFGIVIVVGLLLIGIAFQAQQLRHNERSGG